MDVSYQINIGRRWRVADRSVHVELSVRNGTLAIVMKIGVCDHSRDYIALLTVPGAQRGYPRI